MVAGIVLFAFGLKTTLGDVARSLRTVPALGLVGGIALYLAAHVALRLRIGGGPGRGRPVAAVVLLGLLPVAREVPALTALAFVAAVCVALIAYEALRHREARAWIRSRRGALTMEELLSRREKPPEGPPSSIGTAHGMKGDELEIRPKQPTTKGPADLFTGDVWFDVIAKGEEPSRIRVNTVRFSPGARTAWHAHAVGQTLHVTDGRGLVQARGGEIVEIRPGDTIYAPPGEWHWHGAAPDQCMTHIAMWEAPAEGPESDWGAHVTDAEYLGQEEE